MDIAILASRSGQNAFWIVKAASSGLFPFRIRVIICNGGGACASRFTKYPVPVISIDSDKFTSRSLFEQKLLEILAEYGNPLAVSCSFNRLLTNHFIDSYPNNIFNSHPSLLPAFPGRPEGLKPVDAAIKYGVRIVGATTHFIDAGMDTGAVIMQGALACWQKEESQEIIAKVLRLEALLKISTLCYFGEERVKWNKDSRQVIIKYANEYDNDEAMRKINILISPPPIFISKILPIIDGGAL